MFSGVKRRYEATQAATMAWAERQRIHYGWFDHLIRAVGRFNDVRASRLAAALTYTAFLALFPLLLLALSVLGYVLRGDPDLMDRVTTYLDNNIPTLQADQIADARLSLGVLAVLGVLLTGLNWVSAVRGAVRAIWLQEDELEHAIMGKLADVVVMVCLGALLLGSMVASYLLNSGARWVLDALNVEANLDAYLTVNSYLVATALNVVLFLALLAGVPRFRMPWRRLWPAALLGGICLEIIKRCAGLLFATTLHNPAYTVVATAVGLLLFFNLVNRLLLWCAALTATASTEPISQQPAPSLRGLMGLLADSRPNPNGSVAAKAPPAPKSALR